MAEGDHRPMLMGTPKAALPLLCAVLTLGLAACGSGDETSTTATQPPTLSMETANHLAKLSNRIADDLDNGLTCDAAHAADDLQAAVEDADLAVTIRPGVEEVASRLVDEVNCPPPPPPPEPEPEKKKDEHKQEEKQKDSKSQKQTGHGGKLPPGQAKLEGEEG